MSEQYSWSNYGQYLHMELVIFCTHSKLRNRKGMWSMRSTGMKSQPISCVHSIFHNTDTSWNLGWILVIKIQPQYSKVKENWWKHSKFKCLYIKNVQMFVQIMINTSAQIVVQWNRPGKTTCLYRPLFLAGQISIYMGINAHWTSLGKTTCSDRLILHGYLGWSFQTGFTVHVTLVPALYHKGIKIYFI